jgi:putative FmdB family regulatory protein
MPIYAYACADCGLQQDVMQKMSDTALVTCPECGKDSFSKQLTAPGFQLKGNGYYVTDFKDKPKAACAPCGNAGTCPAANG